MPSLTLAQECDIASDALEVSLSIDYDLRAGETNVDEDVKLERSLRTAIRMFAQDFETIPY